MRNSTELGRLIELLKGDRTYRQMSADTGISYTRICQYVTKGLEPSISSIKKMTSEQSNPRNGVTYEDLMAAKERITSGDKTGLTKDSTELGRLIGLLKGDRTYREMSADTGISYTSLFNYVTKGLEPSISSIKKMTSEQSNPRNGVTYEDLMAAKEQNTDVDKRDALLFNEEYNNIVTNILMNSNEFGCTFRLNKPVYCEDFMPDVSISLIDKGEERWYKILGKKGCVIKEFKEEISKLVFIRPDINRKISFVVSSKLFFDIIRDYENKIFYSGNVSIVLVNTKKPVVMDELYLSRYSDSEGVKEYGTVNN